MWMGADPIQTARALEGAIYHVHAKDTRLESGRQALTSRLETLPWERVDDRAWNYVTPGDGHPGGVEFWSQFIASAGQSTSSGPPPERSPPDHPASRPSAAGHQPRCFVQASIPGPAGRGRITQGFAVRPRGAGRDAS